jgi:hypothetical protein
MHHMFDSAGGLLDNQFKLQLQPPAAESAFSAICWPVNNIEQLRGLKEFSLFAQMDNEVRVGGEEPAWWQLHLRGCIEDARGLKGFDLSPGALA